MLGFGFSRLRRDVYAFTANVRYTRNTPISIAGMCVRVAASVCKVHTCAMLRISGRYRSMSQVAHALTDLYNRVEI